MDQKTILVVEDEAVTAADIEDILEELGHKVAGPVMSGEDAIKLAREAKPDLVLMDISLAGAMNGVEAAARIWDEIKVPVVFLTAYSDEKTLEQAKILNPYGYLLKPFDEADLRATVTLALHRSSLERGRGRSESNPALERARIEQVQVGSKEFTPLSFLSRVDPFRRFSGAELEELAAACSFQSLKSGKAIAQQGDEKRVCFIVVSGRVTFRQALPDGKQLIVTALPPGDIFGVTLLLHEEPLPFSIQAQRETQILVMPETVLKLILQRHPELYAEFAENLREHLFRMQNFALHLAHEKVEARISYLLQELMPVFGKYHADSKTHELCLTRQELAEFCGTAPETAIRVTKTMERDGILDLSQPGRIVVLDEAALAGLGS